MSQKLFIYSETHKIWFEIYIKYGLHQTNLGQNWIYIITYQISLNTTLSFYAHKQFFPLSVQKYFHTKINRNQTVFSENQGYCKMVICKASNCLQSSACRLVLNNPTHWQLLHPALIHEAWKWRWLIYHSFAVKFLAKYYNLQLCREMNVCPWVVTSTKNEAWHFRDHRLQASETVIWRVAKLVWNLCVCVWVLV